MSTTYKGLIEINERLIYIHKVNDYIISYQIVFLDTQ